MADPTDLTTLAAVKTSLRIAQSITVDDDDLATYITAATPVIEDMTGPMVTGQRVRTFDGGGRAVLLPSSIHAIVSVVENGTALADGDYTADLASGIVYRGDQLAVFNWFPGRQNIVITYTAGDAAATADVPANIGLAARELVRIWFQDGQQGDRPGLGGGTQADETVYTPSGFAVTRRISALCDPNPRMPGFA